MPSIFIWKANSPNTSKKLIKFYSGSNWVLEENEYSSKSYIYLEQIVISESDNSVITFNSKDMPQDWVGSELLEVSSVPYIMLKSDKYGTLEMIGDWMRFTTKTNIYFTEDSLKNEYYKIKVWITEKTIEKTILKQEKEIKEKTNINLLDPNKINIDFQNFLNTYNNIQSQPNKIVSTTSTKNYSKYNKTQNYRNNKNYNINTLKSEV